ncbi:MAG: signal recognition particle-docking protein FtsY [Candidatus Latescibacteria bacterium]|jgi:fused signal recognition particle receptor|nr:signal recognition particle-docking protein FtsY [Candidatus Latescibacterota bacterium]
MTTNFFSKIKESLAKTRNELLGSLENILPFGANITEKVLDEVEEILFGADLGVHATEMVVSELRNNAGAIKRKETEPYSVMKKTLLAIIKGTGTPNRITSVGNKPHVIIVVGVNGTGKTTTTGKLAQRFKKNGYSVLLAACDTFRAAAAEQLGIWAERSGSEFIKASSGADAASVAYDAIVRAKSRSTDIVFIDTAGRQHTSRNLMEELKKIRRVINRALPDAPQETLLVLDATTGQNALVQAEKFNREMDVTGIALTKLDGTAKGGIVVSVIDKLGIPVKLIGTGEGIDDLRDFDAESYVEGLLATETQ